MKIFRVNRKAGQWPGEAAEALRSPDAVPLRCLDVNVLADSAINRNNFPSFIPDFAVRDNEEALLPENGATSLPEFDGTPLPENGGAAQSAPWVVEILPAIRIARLGKFIPARFARRYIDALLLTAFIRQPDGEAMLPLAAIFDGALTVGPPFPATLLDNPIEITASYRPLPTRKRTGATPAGPLDRTVTLDPALLMAPETVALLSRYSTLKSGDLILPASIGLTFPVRLNYSLSAALISGGNPSPALSLRLK